MLAYTENTHRGTIVAVGPTADADLSVGDIVAYAQALSTVEIDDVPWLLMRDDAVLGRLQ